MAEVRVKIGADIKDLQKGVRESTKELAGLAAAAAAASKTIGGTGKTLQQIKDDARAAIKASQEFRKSLEETEKQSSGLGTVLRGVFALGIVAELASEIRTKLVAALIESATAAQQAGERYRAAFSAASDFSKLKGPVSVFENIGQITEEAKRLQAELNVVNDRIESLGGDSRTNAGNPSFNLLGIPFNIENIDAAGRKIEGIFSNTQRQNNLIIDQEKQRQAEILAQLTGLDEQFKALEAQNRIAGDRAGSEIRTREEIEAQTEALIRSKRAAEELLRLRAAAFVAVGAPTPFVQRGSTPQATAALPARPDKVFDESAASAAGDFAFSLKEIKNLLDAGLITGLQAANEEFAIMRSRLFDMAAQGLSNTEAYKQLSKEFEILRDKLQAFNDAALATDVFSNLAVDGLEAVVNVKLGFTDAAAAVDSLRQTVQGLIGDLARAALKAAILSGISKALGFATGGASLGFGALLRTGLGIGVVGQASPLSQSLIDAPAAVAPLGRIAQASQSAQVVIPELTIRGNDLVVAFQRARAGSARTLGNIPLK